MENVENQMKEGKQVILVRTDINMNRGKIASQVAHASLGAILNYGFRVDQNNYVLNIGDNEYIHNWMDDKFTKICLEVTSEENLLELYSKAKEKGLNVSLIEDDGRTVFNGVKTKTCCAIGPDNPEIINEITGHLHLL